MTDHFDFSDRPAPTQAYYRAVAERRKVDVDAGQIDSLIGQLLRVQLALLQLYMAQAFSDAGLKEEASSHREEALKAIHQLNAMTQTMLSSFIRQLDQGDKHE
ncbi:hypothetical protein [Rhodoligotrophos ferricapiens]|uniref:hypothetical protein n=1 Tax=Rhodoligotrophos ferricapiens TaxID=3069264 RepID=UPI00315DADE8